MKIRVLRLTFALFMVCAFGLALLRLPSQATVWANPATEERFFLSNPSNVGIKHSRVPSLDVQMSQVVSSGQAAMVLPETSVHYTSTSELFANPERGFYKHTETHSGSYAPLSVTSLESYRQNDNITLILRLFYLDDFVNSAISQSYLDAMQADFDAMRQAGVKSVLRFAYTNQVNGGWPPATPYGDASKAQMLAHLAQLEPLLQANHDVIAVVQAGFIGIWGEWYYTDHFVADPSNPGNVTAADYANRKEVVDAILDALPSERMVQLRTPRYKTNLYSSTSPISSAQAFDGSGIARSGHHNDCFLASSSDFGTYLDVATEYPYLEAETTYLPMGGETCNPNPPRSECATALEELAKFHYSYLNTDYHPDVLSSWVTDGCMDEVKRRLGYRLVLQQGEYRDEVRPGDGFNMQLTLQNEGFAAPFNPRGLEIILRHAVSGEKYYAQLPDDPRLWLAGSAHMINHSIGIMPTMPLGEYELLLNLPDPESALYGRPEYSIRVANDNLWEDATGYNKLLHTLTIATTAASNPHTSDLFFVPMPSPQINLQLGWNFKAFAVEPATGYSAQDVCDQIATQGGNLAEINRWHNSGWDGHVCGQPFNNFDLVLGEGYFINSGSQSTWTIEGYIIEEALPFTLQVGWNSISVPHTDSYTASSLCADIINQGVTALEIDRWHNGGWQGHLCGLPFNDFNIERGTAYFVKATSSGTVTPTQPARTP